MKKPIDPNLNNDESQDFLFGDKINEPTSETKTENDVVKSVLEEKKVEGKPLKLEVAKTNATHEAQSHHHHSSSSSHHHHSSSGSHHHSEHHGEHHHSEHHHHHSSGSSSHHSHHHSSSHHSSSKKKKSKMPKWLKIVLIIFLIFALLVSGTFGTFVFIRTRGFSDLTSIARTDRVHQDKITYKGHTYEFNEDVVSIAFMGVDQREMLNNTETNFVGCTDADIIITVDTKTGAAKVIALPRDTMVDVDQYSSNNVFLKTSNVQLCLAYAYGDGSTQSCTNVTKAMSRILLNVPIKKYFALDLDGIAPLNDSIGGVTVDSIYDIAAYNIKVGDRVTLKGDMAEAYVRTRNSETLESSLRRTDRQVQYVKAFIDQVIPAVRDDVTVVNEFYNTSRKYSQTNLSLNNITYLASLLLSKGINDYEIYTLEGSMASTVTTDFPDAVFAEFTPTEESIMETVLAVYYTQVD